MVIALACGKYLMSRGNLPLGQGYPRQSRGWHNGVIIQARQTLSGPT
jgi:hypothetical protein